MGYDLYYKTSHLSKGGVGLIVKDNIDLKTREDLTIKNTKFTKVNQNTESIWLEREFNDKKHNFILGVIYRHPGSTTECIEDFTRQIKEII